MSDITVSNDESQDKNEKRPLLEGHFKGLITRTYLSLT